jgi:hypothetical protein
MIIIPCHLQITLWSHIVVGAVSLSSAAIHPYFSTSLACIYMGASFLTSNVMLDVTTLPSVALPFQYLSVMR